MERDRDVLELRARRLVYEAVVSTPGTYLSEVARTAGIGPTHARYHLTQLVKARLVSEEADQGFVRYYALAQTRGLEHNVLGVREKALVQALRRPRALHIATALAVHGPMTLADLARGVGRSRPAISAHLQRLVSRGVVARLGSSAAERRYGLVDAAEVVRLLVRYPPRPDAVASFMTLWEGLALPARSKDLGRRGGQAGAQEPGAAGDGWPASEGREPKLAGLLHWVGRLLSAPRRLASWRTQPS